MFACQYCKHSKKIEKRFWDFLIEIRVLNIQNNIVLGTINLFNTFFIQQKRKKSCYNQITVNITDAYTNNRKLSSIFLVSIMYRHSHYVYFK